MNTTGKFDVVVIGGGLAGLSFAILMAQQQRSVLLLEKKSFPYHKVCGEYISNESYPFLIRLGIPLESMKLPAIKKVRLTDHRGNQVEEELTLGGFGISRYLLDQTLANRAKEVGVHILENTPCTHYTKENHGFDVYTSKGVYTSEILVASFGRYSMGNFSKASKQGVNWVGVKYHIQYEHVSDEIALHTFSNGYCGISKIENGQSCLCYIVKASLLKKYKNSLSALEENELALNPFLKDIFNKAVFLYDKPCTISNITFEPKKPFLDGVFYLGDSAGTIAPLTGNGMSNAMRSAYLLHGILESYFRNEISIKDVERNYAKQWYKAFSIRIFKGRWMQQLFCNPALTSLFIRIMRFAPWVKKSIIRQTHGKTF